MNVENPWKSHENSASLRNDNFNTSENYNDLSFYHLMRTVRHH